MSGVLRLLAVGVVLIGAILFLFWLTQRRMMYFPSGDQSGYQVLPRRDAGSGGDTTSPLTGSTSTILASPTLLLTA